MSLTNINLSFLYIKIIKIIHIQTDATILISYGNYKN